ncbi:MAG: dephospho-CoA kinase [Clostridia bacterium]|nr:dephospho-CoA kinase [Clostridia bacterium]
MQSNLKVAITGGIGSGKSTVGGIIAGLGYNVLSCDDIYRNILKDKDI